MTRSPTQSQPFNTHKPDTAYEYRYSCRGVEGLTRRDLKADLKTAALAIAVWAVYEALEKTK
jgi:hypothetical protein